MLHLSKLSFMQTTYTLNYMTIVAFLQNKIGFKGQVRDFKTSRIQII